MKKDFKKKISKSALAMAVMLSVIGTGEAFAANVYWYGKAGNAWTTNQSSAAISGLTLTLTPSSTAESGSWADVNYFYGGYSAASATVSGNTLTIGSGTFTSNNGASDFVAGFSDLGVVSGNILTLNSANFTTRIHLEAGNANGNGNVSGNIVNINNSTFGGNFEADGGQSSGLTSTTLNNAVNVTGSTFNGTATICGSRAAFGNTTSGTVCVAGGIFNGDTEIRGNSSLKGTATNGKVEIKESSKFTGQATIYGSYTGNYGGAATGGKVTITGSEFNGNETTIYGSYAENDAGGNATGGEVTIDYAYFRDGSSVYISGGFGIDTASGNKVTINDIDFYNITNCHISAGVAGSEISGNELTINSGDFTGVKILNILGGNGDNAVISNNTITINGGKFPSVSTEKFCIYAGDGGAATGTGNVLNINTCVDGIVEEIYEPQTINFKAPSGMDTGLPMLSLRNAVALAGVNISVDVSKISLAADDFITLIDYVDREGYTPADGHYQVLTVDDSHYFLVYSGSTDPITVEPDVVVVAGGNTYKSDKSKGVYYDVFNATDLTTKITGNKMDIAGGTYKKDVYGAGAIESTGNHTVSNNIVNIEGGTFESNDETIHVVAGYGENSGDASFTVRDNELNISDGKFLCSLAAGWVENNAAGSTISASNNVLNVSGGTFRATPENLTWLYGVNLNDLGNNNIVTASNNKVVFGAEDVEKISVGDVCWMYIYGC